MISLLGGVYESFSHWLESALIALQYHSVQYPTLARIARDYLAIQGSATASERAFSNGSLTATQRRNRLAPDMFEALQILKSAYRNNHIGAAEEATQRMIGYFDALDNDDTAV
jgi:hypothetical protein